MYVHTVGLYALHNNIIQHLERERGERERERVREREMPNIQSLLAPSCIDNNMTNIIISFMANMNTTHLVCPISLHAFY